MLNKSWLNVFNGWTILVIDDEMDSLEVASIILEAYGAEVLQAKHGEEGLRIARTHTPRLIISDISMPVMDGWGFIHALRRDEAIKSIPVIALTAHAMPGDSERVLNAGFDNYLSKPLTVERFMESLMMVMIATPQLAAHLKP